MNEEMKAAWLEISQMLGEPTREELDVFLRTWQRASQATREALAEQPAQKCSYPYCGCNSKAWCKVERNEALDKKAENARELGLDYEPADGTQVSKVWWDGEKLMAKPIPLEDFYLPASGCTRSHPHENMDAMCELRTEIARLTNENARLKAQPAPVQEPVACVIDGDLYFHHEIDWEDLAYQGHGVELLYTAPPAAQRQWVGLTDEDIIKCTPTWGGTVEDVARAIEAKLKEKNT